MKIAKVTLILGYPDGMDQEAVRVALSQTADALSKGETFIGAEVLSLQIKEVES